MPKRSRGGRRKADQKDKKIRAQAFEEGQRNYDKDVTVVAGATRRSPR